MSSFPEVRGEVRRHLLDMIRSGEELVSRLADPEAGGEDELFRMKTRARMILDLLGDGE